MTIRRYGTSWTNPAGAAPLFAAQKADAAAACAFADASFAAVIAVGQITVLHVNPTLVPSVHRTTIR